MAGKKIRRKRQRSLFSMTTADEFSMLDSGRVSSRFDPMSLSTNAQPQAGALNDDSSLANKEPPSLDLLAEMIKEEIRQASGLKQALDRVGIETKGISQRVSNLEQMADGDSGSAASSQPECSPNRPLLADSKLHLPSKPKKQVQFVVPDDVRFRWLDIFKGPDDPHTVAASAPATGGDGDDGDNANEIQDDKGGNFTQGPDVDAIPDAEVSEGCSDHIETLSANADDTGELSAATERLSVGHSDDNTHRNANAPASAEVADSILGLPPPNGHTADVKQMRDLVHGPETKDKNSATAAAINGDATSSHGSSSSSSRLKQLDPSRRKRMSSLAASATPSNRNSDSGKESDELVNTSYTENSSIEAVYGGSRSDTRRSALLGNGTSSGSDTSNGLGQQGAGANAKRHSSASDNSDPAFSSRLQRIIFEAGGNGDLNSADSNSYHSKYATISGRGGRRISARLLRELQEVDDTGDGSENANASPFAVLPPVSPKTAAAAAAAADGSTSPKLQFENHKPIFSSVSPSSTSTSTTAKTVKTAASKRRQNTPKKRYSVSPRFASSNLAHFEPAYLGSFNAESARSEAKGVGVEAESEVIAVADNMVDRDLHAGAASKQVEDTPLAGAEHGNPANTSSHGRRNSVDGSTRRGNANSSSHFDKPRRRAETDTDDSSAHSDTHSHQPSLFRRVTTSAAHRKNSHHREDGGILGGTREFFKTHLRTRTNSHSSQSSSPQTACAPALGNGVAAQNSATNGKSSELLKKRSDSEVKFRDVRLKSPGMPLPQLPLPPIPSGKEASVHAATAGVGGANSRGSEKQPNTSASSAPSSSTSAAGDLLKAIHDDSLRSTRRSQDERMSSSLDQNRTLRRTANTQLDPLASATTRQKELPVNTKHANNKRIAANLVKSRLSKSAEAASTAAAAAATTQPLPPPPPPPRQFTSKIGKGSQLRSSADQYESDGNDSAVQSPPLPKMPSQGVGIDRIRRTPEKKGSAGDVDAIDYHMNKLGSGKKSRRSSFMVTLNHMLGRKE